MVPGNRAKTSSSDAEATEEAIEKFNEALGYNRPFGSYLDWLSDAVRGDFDANFTDGRLVTGRSRSSPEALRSPRVYAFILCVPISILAGDIAAVRRPPIDRTSRSRGCRSP